MPTVIFVRHGRSSANTSGTLAGWMPGVYLDETGEVQADGVGVRLAAASLPVVEVVSSPLDRCVQTADRLSAPLPGTVRRSVHAGLGECRYGAWTGRPISELVSEELWKVVQDRPSEARFPDSAAYPAESLSEMQARALDAVREIDARVLEAHGADAVWVAVSHGDVIKSILSHATGAQLDDFQRINVDPASVSVVRYTSRKPFVLRLNDVGGDLAGLRPPERRAVAEGDAEVGGGAGTGGITGGTTTGGADREEPADRADGPGSGAPDPVG
ncbi:MSMEG_4193 family putative phosphomutase [Humibacillus xanthopallidus]|uniref:Putative phosphomutase (TIGR03848 family) n=1 Tax=Humibacillus xanthopallidus TaxID=412689 RepID=A0A543HIJ1_9MICO|nr:MSMEG_4193 family putative phosphomutase [Humibacillus xanthopallidus]TQM58156.1 putative phosphomutase (TIGR03848 family) [Humibacillus xanthopallidus]